MRILLADPEGNVRYGLTALLEEHPDLHIVGEATHAGELTEKIQRMCPDLLLLSWELPGVIIGELIHNIRTICPELLILVLSARTEAKQTAFFAGADGFISKTDPPELLLASIQSLRTERGEKKVD